MRPPLASLHLRDFVSVAFWLAVKMVAGPAPGLPLETYGHVAGIAVHHRVPGPVCAGARVKA